MAPSGGFFLLDMAGACTELWRACVRACVPRGYLRCARKSGNLCLIVAELEACGRFSLNLAVAAGVCTVACAMTVGHPHVYT